MFAFAHTIYSFHSYDIYFVYDMLLCNVKKIEKA